ncbi:MarR family winged helix-turn-helix transcriptional regulator [Nocardia wallacei]|uniref:MarR family winged helix-turn-helix transcriptional regulator n=1 Tax=Nocardia wallacei TaxID=480035 RepID=UPI002453DBDA|nr:MarR family winged helix-turn-helix transcriptional regulator [Nocardia wallacei]
MDIGEYEAVPSRLRAMPSRLVNLAAISANRLTDQALHGTGSRRYHYALLAALDEFGPSSQADLGRCTRIDRSEIVETVNDLVGHAFVKRKPDPADRRRNIVSITAAGVRHLQKLDILLEQAQAQFLTSLSAGERKVLVRLLTRVVEGSHSSAETVSK